jgi:hypothetical protein
VLRQFAKVQVEELGAHRWLVYCQGEGRGSNPVVRSKESPGQKLFLEWLSKGQVAILSTIWPNPRLDELVVMYLFNRWRRQDEAVACGTGLFPLSITVPGGQSEPHVFAGSRETLEP